MQRIVNGLGMIRRLWQALGPYLLLEILLPGGTLVAMLLFLYQRTRNGQSFFKCLQPMSWRWPFLIKAPHPRALAATV